MLGLIISDSHNNIVNLQKVFENYADKADFLIHCGDVNDKETLDFIIKNFNKDIYIVWGNTDVFSEDIDLKQVYQADKDRLHFFKKVGKFKIKNYEVAITHYPKIAKDLQAANDYTFYGHSHKPYLAEINNKHWLVNPGNVAGLYQKASFALWYVDKGLFELKLLERL